MLRFPPTTSAYSARSGASNLHQFLQRADGVDDETWDFHRKAGDFSKWVQAQMKDEELANELATSEVNKARPVPKDTRAAIVSRYKLPAGDAPSARVE